MAFPLCGAQYARKHAKLAEFILVNAFRWLLRCQKAAAGSEDAEMAKSEQWYALKVQAGFEPLIAQELRKRNIAVVLIGYPTAQSQDRNPSDRFLFARLPAGSRREISTLPGFICLAGVPGATAVPDYVMSDLQTAVEADLELTVVPGNFESRSGRISGGPLDGRPGKFLHRQGCWHMVVPITALDRTFLFALPDCSVLISPALSSR
jgi:hypothetical protein